jgi:hypothetical protein
VKVNQRFGGTYCLHLQGQRVSQARNHKQADSKQTSFMLALLFNSENKGDMFL